MCILGAEDLSTVSDTQITLSGAPANVSDLIEFGSELVLVTAKNSDPDPIYTVSRGYYGSSAAVSAAGTIGVINPQWARVRVAEAILRAFPRLEALGLPLIESATMNCATGTTYVVLPEPVREVKSVGYFQAQTGRFMPLDSWQQFDNLPTSVIANGKILRMARYVDPADDLQVTYTTPYRWSTHPAAPNEAATIQIPEGAVDLPAAYAAAWLVSKREISRSEIDRSTEWNQGEPQRGGVSSTLVRNLWQEFYRQLDEARRLSPMPIARPYIRMAKVY